MNQRIKIMLNFDLYKIKKYLIGRLILIKKALLIKLIDKFKFNLHGILNKKLSPYIESEDNRLNKIFVNSQSNIFLYEKINTSNYTRFKMNEFYNMSDSEKYIIVKHQLQTITKGERKSKDGEVEYLKSLLKLLKNK